MDDIEKKIEALDSCYAELGISTGIARGGVRIDMYQIIKYLQARIGELESKIEIVKEGEEPREGDVVTFDYPEFGDNQVCIISDRGVVYEQNIPLNHLDDLGDVTIIQRNGKPSIYEGNDD